MYCQKCGAELEENVNFCSNCGNTIVEKSTTVFEQPQSKNQGNGRGTLILILGIFSLIFGLFLGIPAWIMGNADLKKIKNGLISVSEKFTTKVGMILGIIGTFFSGIGIVIMGIAIVAGINVFTASSVNANRDALISDMTTLAAMAQQYHKKPSALGGEGGSYTNWSIPQSLTTTANGKYHIEEIKSQNITLVGLGYEIGEDGINPTKVLMKIKPSGASENLRSIRASMPDIETQIMN